MRLTVLTALLVLGFVDVAMAQPASRIEIGPVLRFDRVAIEGGAGGSTTVAGAVATFRTSKILGLEAEVTQASGRIERSYEGWFISYVTTPNPTREEIERMAPTARRSLGYEPGLGWVVALTARGEVNRRVKLGARLGVSARDYVETSTYTILSIPEGVDPRRVASDFQNDSFHRSRGGLVFGIDGSVAVTKHLSVAPELRFVYGGPARIGNTHREAGFGARATWRF